jgi:hypothetical protein
VNVRLRLADALRQIAALVDDEAERSRQVLAEVEHLRASEELLLRLQVLARVELPAEEPLPEPIHIPPTAVADELIECPLCVSVIARVVAMTDSEPLAHRRGYLRFIRLSPVVMTRDGLRLCAYHAGLAGGAAQPLEAMS